MNDHPFQPGTVWAPKRGKAKPRRVVAPKPVRVTAGSWMAEFIARKDVVWYDRADYPVTLDTFRRWAGEKISE
jgi:hypothetical protein